MVVAEGDPELGALTENLGAFPIASASLALLLRGQPGRFVDDGLVAESAVYSVLQSGPEFAAWRAATSGSHGGWTTVHTSRFGRDGPKLTVTLARPDRLNALDARMRDELLEGLTSAGADPGITMVELRGEGEASLLRRRRPRRVRQPARPGDRAPHPAPAQRRSRRVAPEPADDRLPARGVRGIGH